VWQELGFQQGRGAAAEATGEPGGDPDPGQGLQHTPGPPDRQVVPATQQRRQRTGLRTDPDRATWTHHQRHPRIGYHPAIGCYRSPDGRSCRLGPRLGGTSRIRDAEGGIPQLAAGLYRAGHISGGGVIDLPTPATPS
jgi:hypothetical protein